MVSIMMNTSEKDTVTLSDKITIDLNGSTFVDYEHVVQLVGSLSTDELVQLSNLVEDLLDKDLG